MQVSSIESNVLYYIVLLSTVLFISIIIKKKNKGFRLFLFSRIQTNCLMSVSSFSSQLSFQFCG